MSVTLRTNAAAAMLGISPSTLRTWERRFSFPSPTRTQGGHRVFKLAELEALRDALGETSDPAAAVALARAQDNGVPTTSLLTAALRHFDEQKADRLVEQSLALRGFERTIEELLLAAVSQCGEPDSPERQGAARYTAGWLAAQKRVTAPAAVEQGVLIVDAADPLSLDTLHAQALELLLRRSGLRTLSLTQQCAPDQIKRAARALKPQALVLCGRGETLETLGQLVYAVRSVVGGVEVFNYREALPDTGASTVRTLGGSLDGACAVIASQLAQVPLTREFAKSVI